MVRIVAAGERTLAGFGARRADRLPHLPGHDPAERVFFGFQDIGRGVKPARPVGEGRAAVSFERSAGARNPLIDLSLAERLETPDSLTGSGIDGSDHLYHCRGGVEIEKRIRWGYCGVPGALSAAAFGLLAYAVVNGNTTGFDRTIRDWVHAFASPGLTLSMYVLTQLGSVGPLIVLGGVAAWCMKPRKRSAILLLAAAGGGEGIDRVLKLIFHRPRPQTFFELPQPATYSFPSGHAMAACCFYGMMAVLVTRRVRSPLGRVAVWTVAILVAAAVGLSRIYLGVHYPSDVAGGYLAGAAWLLLIEMIGIA